MPSHHAENLATKIGCIIDLNEDDRINQDFYEMALKRIKVLCDVLNLVVVAWHLIQEYHRKAIL